MVSGSVIDSSNSWGPPARVHHHPSSLRYRPPVAACPSVLVHEPAATRPIRRLHILSCCKPSETLAEASSGAILGQTVARANAQIGYLVHRFA
jgi:hypothetical protein